MNEVARPPSEDDLLEIVALADGSLDPAREAEVAARMAESPALADAFERQVLAIALVRAAAPAAAPQEAREPVEAERKRVKAEGRRRGRLRPRLTLPRLTLPRLAGGAVAGAAAAALVIAVLVIGGGAQQPKVAEVAALGAQVPTERAPAISGADRARLRLSVGGVAFPNFHKRFNWRAVGAREDEVDGRRVATVFYEGERRQISYSIVDGEALAWPRGSRRSVARGMRFETFRRGATTVVTWRKGGRTCILSARDVPPEQLRKLAAWTV